MQSDSRIDYVPTTDVPDNLSCAICIDMALDAQECKVCESLFCQQCAQDWKKKNNQQFTMLIRCPNRCEGEFTLKPPHRLIRNELAKIKFFCRNRSLGCNETITFELVGQHVLICKFKPVFCAGKCGWKGIQPALKAHSNQCALVPEYECDQCMAIINKEHKAQHNCIISMREEIVQLKQMMNQMVLEQKRESELLRSQVIKQEEKQSLLMSIIAENPNLNSSIIQYQMQNQKQEQKQEQLKPIQKKPSIEPPLKVDQPMQCEISGQLTEPNPLVTCRKGHGLQFWMSPGVAISEQYCDRCLKVSICRYVCKSCKVYYCQQCIPPQLKLNNKRIPTHCPAGHVIGERNASVGGYVCDICSKDSTTMVDKRALQCRQCDFDICSMCLKKNNMVGTECVIF